MSKEARINERIRVPEVRVIGDDGAQLGVMTSSEGVRLAREQGLDLVEVSPTVSPPVCRIMDYSRYKYEQSKKERLAKKKQHAARLKEIKFRPNIDEHDYRVKLSQIRKFLTKKDKTKITLMFRGREMAHLDLGRKVLDRVAQDTSDVGIVERMPFLEGRFMTMVVMPKA
ncbi:MAG: translation initiation factor IF-3 [Candidatus Omnitrophica bacterium]|nr:translation initiation factor IF-3 [Candidatus Omnitrophota bacterium]